MPVELTAKEFAILALLFRARGEVVGRDRILDEVWGEEVIDSRRIDAHIVNLRRKLEDDARGLGTSSRFTGRDTDLPGRARALVLRIVRGLTGLLASIAAQQHVGHS